MSNLLNIKDQNGNWIPIPVITNGIRSITQNQDYTLTITLNDGTTYTTTSIRGEKGDQGIQGIQGDTGAKGDKGDTYTLTPQDKTDIINVYKKDMTEQTNQILTDLREEVDETITTIEQYEQNAKQYSDQSVASAESAQVSADRAAEAAQLATNEANKVTQSATNAHTDAETAMTAKDDAVSAKNDAVNAKDTTVTAKNEVVEIKNVVDSAKQTAIDQAKDSEAWAIGQRDGTDVPDTDEAFHNNAKYYNSLAASYAGDAQDAALNASGSAIDAGTKADEARQSAQSASQSAEATRNLFNSIDTELNKKVDKITGKGLSSNDFTTTEKQKLAEIAEGATNIVIDNTLTQAGEAADAQAVGDAIDAVKRDMLNYITPQIFGAKANGITDDTLAIKSAIEYAMTNRCAVYLPSGTYAINPQIIKIEFVGNDSLVMFGDGKTSCIKRMDDSLNSKEDTLFVINNKNATADSGIMYIHDLFIDSNRRNQTNVTDDFTYETAADFMIYFSNTDGYALETAVFKNIWFYDGVADHLDFTGDGVVHIKNIVIDKVFTSGRQGTRNDIDFPGIPMKNVFISNVFCQRIHTEYNGEPTEPQYFNLSNVICDEFTCGGKYSRYKVVNLTVKNLFIFGNVTNGLFTNCEFNLTQNKSYIISTNGKGTVRFNNCIFKSYDVETPIQSVGRDSDCGILYIRKYFNVVFTNCVFEYVGEYDYTSKTLYPISALYVSAEDDVSSNEIKINGCTFSNEYTYLINAYGCGTVRLSNMNVWTKNILRIDTANGRFDANFENINFSGEDVLSIGGIKLNTCTLRGHIVCKQGSFKLSDSTNQYVRIDVKHLKISQYISVPLTRDFLNTIYRLSNNYFMLTPMVEFIYVGDNAEAYPSKWECITNAIVPNSQFNNARHFKSIGSGIGDTASRPICILSPGFNYFDTDLNKTIVWDGTTWINVDGTTL